MSLKTIQLTLSANQELPIPEMGNTITLVSSTGSLELIANGKNQKMLSGSIAEYGKIPDQIFIKDLSGSSNTVELSVGVDSKLTLPEGTDSATETTLGTIKTELDVLNDLSFGRNGATILKTGTTTKTVTFRGIQVYTDLAIVTITGSNVGTDLDGVTLTPGYYPVTGTAIDVTGNAGLAILVTE